MPNWCFNSLHISGPFEDVKRFVHEAKHKTDEKSQLSFNNHVPVWEGTKLIEGKDPYEEWGTNSDANSVDLHSEDVGQVR